MKPTIQELDAAIGYIKEELDSAVNWEEYECEAALYTALQALKFARAMMELKSGRIAMIGLDVLEENGDIDFEYPECTMLDAVKAITEQAWEEVVIAERLAKKENGITVEELERRLEE